MSEEHKGTDGSEGDKFRSQVDRMWKNAIESLEDLREVVVKASQSARVKLDATFLRRERDRLYQQLGEELYERIESRDLKTPPGLRDTVDRIHAVVEQMIEEEAALDLEDDPGEPEPATKKKATKKKRKSTKKKKATGQA